MLFKNVRLCSNDIVISVPDYSTNIERQGYLDSMRIAGLNCLRIINESSAIALCYGFQKANELDATTPRAVAFVDMGHSKLTVTIAEFLKT